MTGVDRLGGISQHRRITGLTIVAGAVVGPFAGGLVAASYGLAQAFVPAAIVATIVLLAVMMEGAYLEFENSKPARRATTARVPKVEPLVSTAITCTTKWDRITDPRGELCLLTLRNVGVRALRVRAKLIALERWSPDTQTWEPYPDFRESFVLFDRDYDKNRITERINPQSARSCCFVVVALYKNGARCFHVGNDRIAYHFGEGSWGARISIEADGFTSQEIEAEFNWRYDPDQDTTYFGATEEPEWMSGEIGRGNDQE